MLVATLSSGHTIQVKLGEPVYAKWGERIMSITELPPVKTPVYDLITDMTETEWKRKKGVVDVVLGMNGRDFARLQKERPHPIDLLPGDRAKTQTAFGHVEIWIDDTIRDFAFWCSDREAIDV